MHGGGAAPLATCGLNHISRVCSDVQASLDFYVDVLGFVPVKRPTSLELSFHGAWLFKHGLGIHLIEGLPPPRSDEIRVKDDHISFVAEDLDAVARQIEALGLPYKRYCVEENGVKVQQLFIHDPDRNMIEVCECDRLPVIPLAAASSASCADALRAAGLPCGGACALAAAPGQLSGGEGGCFDSRDSMDSVVESMLPATARLAGSPC